MEVVLGGREAVEASVVGEQAQGADLIDHRLEALVVAADGPQLLPLLQGPGNRRQDEQLELHAVLLVRATASGTANPLPEELAPAGHASPTASRRAPPGREPPPSVSLRARPWSCSTEPSPP